VRPLTRPHLTRSALTASLALSLVATATPAFAAPLTPYQMPFPCGQTWTGSTRSGHSPSTRSIDWNRAEDTGSAVVAAAPGVVAKADATGTSGYGHHVVVDHQNGESTVYAHLDAVVVATGQRVDQGAQLGTVGATGNARGAHLHFEEKSGRSVIAAWFAGAPYRYGAATSANCVDVPIAGNFVGDAAAEVGVYRRARRSTFVVNDPAGSARVLPFGRSVDEPVIGDWDGDGASNVGIRVAKRSKFKLQTPTGIRKLVFGVPSDRPVAGDWNGDGLAEVGLHRSSSATFYLRAADGTVSTVVLGDSNDVPVTGDWNGDRVTDLGVFDQATATFALRVVDVQGQVWTAGVQLGAAWDLPVAGDWDGNGITDLGVWSPATATFVQSRTAPMATQTSQRLEATSIRFGRPRR
jgi:Peptidase family M23